MQVSFSLLAKAQKAPGEFVGRFFLLFTGGRFSFRSRLVQLNRFEDTPEETFIGEPTINHKCKDVGVSRPINDVGDRTCDSLVYADVEHFELLKEELFFVTDSPTAFLYVLKHGVEVCLQVQSLSKTVDLKEIHPALMPLKLSDAVSCPNRHRFPIVEDFEGHLPRFERAISEWASSSH